LEERKGKKFGDPADHGLEFPGKSSERAVYGKKKGESGLIGVVRAKARVIYWETDMD